MPNSEKDYGYRTTILIPEDLEKQIQRFRKSHVKVNGYNLSRSALTIRALREFFKKHPHAVESEQKGASNGQ